MITIIDLYKEARYEEVGFFAYLLCYGPYIPWLLPLIFVKKNKKRFLDLH